jgi:hypothetical protein
MNLFEDENAPTGNTILGSYRLDDEKSTYNKLGSLTGLVSEMDNQSAKVSDADFNVEIPETLTETEADEASPAEKKQAQNTSQFIVNTADELISRALSVYAKTDPEKLMADKADIDQIAQHFAPYFGVSNFNIQPWVMGTIVAAFVLFDKFKLATEMRNINIALENEKKRTADLEARIKELELEKKEKELEQKVESLKKEVDI